MRSQTVPIFDFGWQWADDRLVSPLIQSSRTQFLAGLKSADQITLVPWKASIGEATRSSLARGAFLRDDAEGMPATLEQTGPNLVTSRSAFVLRFISTVALWTVALLIMFS